MMDGETFTLRWEDDERTEDAIMDDSEQMAAENLMYLSQEVSGYPELDAGVECVTEEVITDDWVVPAGQERVEVPLDQLTQPVMDVKEENDIDVPLPTDQDEYTAARPWPCDFCPRRFRNMSSLVSHMVAHQGDRPLACNLCGERYRRKPDLLLHLKEHAFVPPPSSPPSSPRSHPDYDEVLENHQVTKPKKKRGRRKKIPEPEEENSDVWENMTSARTQQWQRKRPPPAPSSPPPAPPSPSSPPSPSPPPPPPPPPPADPSRPFVCRHCGVGFAREKALQSHARVHGGESPLECATCGELCWSREALRAHARRRHPHVPPPPPPAVPKYRDSSSELDDSEDAEYQLSGSEGSEGGAGRHHGERGGRHGARPPPLGDMRPPELFCQHCGVAFQRADLLRRHVAAAHSYRRRSSGGSSTWEAGGAEGGVGAHACDVCGEACSDALSLLAHAERHTHHRLKRNKRNASSNNSRQFPCKECGKVFGSRSSQQIHVRIHTGERPYACRFCWKAFADGGTLRKHERIHTGEKPYACAVCPRAFNQRVVLREHVRSHHAAPSRRSAASASASALSAPFVCAVCARALPSSGELVQHLIQHCDDNTAARRHPQTGPRKYKRRKKLREKIKLSSSPSPPASPPPAPPPPPARPAPVRRAARRPVPPPTSHGPRMIHTTEENRPRTKQVQRSRRARRVPPPPAPVRPPPRRPADDLRAIRPHLASVTPTPSPTPSPSPPPSPPSPPSPPTGPPLLGHVVKHEHDHETYVSGSEESSGAIVKSESCSYRCDMCDARFDRRSALLLHVPTHI